MSGQDEIETRQVASRQELESALGLVHDSYCRSGFMNPSPHGIRITEYYALPTTRTYVGVLRGQVIATVSLFADSPLRLPVDRLYGDVIQPLRKEGRKIGEVGMLADRRLAMSRRLEILLEMMRCVLWTARQEAMDDLLVTVHPRHAGFYAKLLRFEPFGPQRQYDAVGGAPAVLLLLDLTRIMQAKARAAWIRRLFLESTPQADQDGYRMRAEDLEHFFARQSDVLGTLSPEKTRIIETFYPGLRIPDMLARTAGSAGV